MVIVRVPKHDEISLTTALDAGAAGIIFPHVSVSTSISCNLYEVFCVPILRLSSQDFLYKSRNKLLILPGIAV